MEDAQALTLLLSHHLKTADESQPISAPPITDQDAIRIAGEQFCSIRKARVESILDKANQMGERKKVRGVIGEWTTYLFMWAMLMFFPNMMNQHIMSYSVEKEVERVLQKSTKVGK